MSKTLSYVKVVILQQKLLISVHKLYYIFKFLNKVIILYLKKWVFYFEKLQYKVVKS